MQLILRPLKFGLLGLLLAITFLGVLASQVMAAGAVLLHQTGISAGLPLAPLALGVNSLGTLSGTIVIQRALELTFTKFPRLGAFAKGFKELDGRVASANLGQSVASRLLQVSSITNFESGAQNFTTTDVTGTLRNFRQIHHRFTAAEVNSTDRRLIDEAAMPMAIGLAKGIVDAYAAMVSRQNFNTTTNSTGPTLTVASGWSYANTLVPLMGALDQRGVRDAGRYFLASGAVNQALLVDPLVVAALNNPANANAIQTGILPQIISGLSYDKYPVLPNTDSNLLGFAGTPDAIMYLARAPMTPDEVFGEAAARAPFAYGIITEPTTGFSVMVQQWMETNLSINTRLVWLDGVEVGNPNNLVRLVSAVVTGTSGTITGATVTNPGYGYRDNTGAIGAPTVTISGGGGTGATATATVDAVGGVTAITITAPGSGYTTVPTITIAPSSGGRADGPATASLKVAGYA